jgi:hypothetical protein
MPNSLHHSTPIYDGMLRRLSEARALFYKERILSGGALVATLILASVCFLSLIEALLNGSSTLRTIMFFVGAACNASVAAWFVVLPALRWKKIFHGVSEKEVADLVGNRFPEVKDRLRNILEIFEEQATTGGESRSFRPDYSSALIDASFGDLQKAASSMNFADIVSFAPFRRAIKYLSLVAASILIVFVIPQLELPFAAYRLIHFRTDFRQPDPFTFLIQPGNAEIVKGESVPISIYTLANAGTTNHLRAALPKTITLVYHQIGVNTNERIDLRADSSGQFRTTLASLKQSVEYRAEAEGIQSATYTIAVIDRPMIRSLKVHLTPPAYSHLPPQSLDENLGDVLALPGTIVTWQITLNKDLHWANIVFGDGNKVSFARRDPRVSGEAYFGEHTLRSRATYRFELEDMEGFLNANAIEYTLDIIADETPTVAVVYPGRNIDVANEMQLPLRLHIHDDFGLTSLKLGYRLIHSRYEEPKKDFSFIAIPLTDETKKSSAGDVNFLWDVSPLGLVPEDIVEYHAEVFDNDNISGPKRGLSQSFLLRLPSLDEVFADADNHHNDAIQKLDTSLEEAEELKKNLDELSQEMKKNRPLDWQQQQKAEETLKQYQELTKKIDDVSKSVDAMAQEMQKNNILSSETMQKYMELQQLLQQIDSPEFREAMKKMQAALLGQNVSPDQLRQAMEQVQFSEEAFRQGIERTMELLKRIQVEQKMDEMVKRSNELQQQQENLQKETDASNLADERKSEELARKQDDINKQLAELQKQLEELRKKMEEFPKDMPMKELDKAEQAAHDSTMEQSMQESSQQLRQSLRQQTLQSQQKANKGMQQMSQRFSEMQEQLLNSQMAETMNALRKAMRDLLEISQQEEDLKNQSQALDPNSQQFRENAQQQMNLQGDLADVTNSLVELGQKSFAVTPEMGRAIGKAMGNMAQAMNGLEQRNGQSAGAQQGEAMASLNNAASLVQSSMDAMEQDGQGGGMGSLLQQLRRMAGQQQSINIQTEQLSQGQGMSQQQIQEMGRLAKQQEAVRKSLEDLNKEAQGNQDRNRILGDLQKIADEMKEVVENLRQNNVNPNTIQQQQRILSRLLDAQTSMRERDFEQRRKSLTGTTQVRRSPMEIQNDSALDQLRRDLLKAAEEGYSKDYQELIRKYYDALNKTEGK